MSEHQSHYRNIKLGASCLYSAPDEIFEEETNSTDGWEVKGECASKS